MKSREQAPQDLVRIGDEACRGVKERIGSDGKGREPKAPSAPARGRVRPKTGQDKRDTHWRYHSILSISFNLGLRSGSTVSILSTSCAIADVCADPSRRHGSCARIEPFRYAANSGLAGVGSSQGVSGQITFGSVAELWQLLEIRARRKGN